MSGNYHQCKPTDASLEPWVSELLFVSAVRLGAAVIDQVFFVKAESFNFFQTELGILITFAAFWVGGCGQGWKIASSMALDKGAHHLGFSSIACAILLHSMYNNLKIAFRSWRACIVSNPEILSATGHWCLRNSAQDRTVL